MYLLGYIPADSRLYLGDKELNVVSFQLLLSVLEYQTAVMRRDFETADKVNTRELLDNFFVIASVSNARFRNIYV
jgi:hypothetical protein